MGLTPEHAVHPFAPVWDVHCRVLVLGSFPSVRSREIGFYYGHPQNRFWRVLERLYGQPVPPDTAAAAPSCSVTAWPLWDVLAACDIVGSSDASIRHAVPNDVPRAACERWNQTRLLQRATGLCPLPALS